MEPFVFADLKGITLDEAEKVMLQHPLVAGLTLFSKNYHSVAQLCELTAEVKSIRPDLLIAVDHEGGRVQRFKEGFTAIPDMKRLTEHCLADSQLSMKGFAWLVGSELSACGIDINFAPVLDIDRGLNTVIGDRAFHRDPAIITEMTAEYAQGLSEAGIIAVGKHFPGHGGVALDSHIACPVDERTLDQIMAQDIVPFHSLIKENLLAGIMPAHVIYPNVDSKPASFSEIWLKKILREQLGFSGSLFSDDLSMKAAQIGDSLCSSVVQSLAAGCDYVLLSNYQGDWLALLEEISRVEQKPIQQPAKLKGCSTIKQNAWQTLKNNERYQQAQAQLMAMGR